MSRAGTPTFDQLRIFLAVVEAGGFAAAARRLGRAVSVISYGISHLETQLGVALFEREGARSPVLTEAGRAVLAEAQAIASGFDALAAKVQGLLDGLEAELHLAVDVMLPADRIGVILRAFATRFPTVALRLHVEALGAVAARVAAGGASLGISGPVGLGMTGLDYERAGCLALLPVASPDHPLARMQPIPPGAVRRYVQLVLSDPSGATTGRDFAVLSPETWRLSDLGAKGALLREGIGWGNMPQPAIANDLLTGALVRLEIPESPGGLYRFFAVWRRDHPPGPAAQWLRAQFVAHCATDTAPPGLAEL